MLFLKKKVSNISKYKLVGEGKSTFSLLIMLIYKKFVISQHGFPVKTLKYTWQVVQQLLCDWSDTTTGKALTLHSTNLGSVPGIPYGPPKHHEEWFLSSGAKTLSISSPQTPKLISTIKYTVESAILKRMSTHIILLI